MSDIAVLVPTYKPGDYLERCLDSLENQTLSRSEFKVYLVLNGSEGSYKVYIQTVLQNYHFNYEFFDIKEAGVSNARNFLIENSTEDFIVFLDDDDLISQNYLAELRSVTSESFMGITNIVNFEKDLSSLKSNYIGNSFLKLKSIETSKTKSRKYFSSPVAKMLHRKMIGETRFNTNLSVGEDSLFMTEISNKIKGIKKTDNDVLYYVCEREGSATRSRIDKPKEIKRVAYLTYLYSKMLFSPRSDKTFLLTRVLATVRHLKKIF
ncbi:glycosyltransferase family 2 protein [Psychrobacter submarinus]|uniref:glycosyltransferase family 2 protein n=1 Tax=Psychrobacter submarinus TaxID=154108 RepID=UPI001917A6F6|nr:glycosyltransferase family A protein [Psychrobacter submarinus]